MMVKILTSVPGTKKLEEIGELDFQKELPNGVKTKCDHCGKKIEADLFIFGYKHGYPNMSFHITGCIDQGELFEDKKSKKNSPITIKKSSSKKKKNAKKKEKVKKNAAKKYSDLGLGPGK
jgi:hypothetical protein